MHAATGLGGGSYTHTTQDPLGMDSVIANLSKMETVHEINRKASDTDT